MLDLKLNDIKKGNLLTKFLTLEKQLKQMSLNVQYSFDDLEFNFERKRAYIKSSIINDDLIFDINQTIVIFKIKYNKKFSELNHKDVLGSLMGIGITRESIGDIICLDNGNIYFFITKEIEKFVMTNLIKIKTSNVDLEICSINELLNEINETSYHNYIEEEIIVSSLRLDIIVSDCMHLSREKAKQYISLKNVKVNGDIETKPDLIIKVDDLISIHRYGRFILKEVLKKTKKDKYLLRVLHTK